MWGVSPHRARAANYYRWADPLWRSPHVRGGGFDHYTEGLLDPAEGAHGPLPASHAAKFDWMYRACGGGDGDDHDAGADGAVGAAAGDGRPAPLRVLDVGCGNGAFLRYCRDRGAVAVGLTPSPPQVRGLRAAGLAAHPVDVWALDDHPELHGRFDAVVVNGSSEHFLDVSQSDPAVQRARFARCFALLRRCLDPDSPHRRCVLTAICGHRDLGAWEYVQAYLLERSYGGRYVGSPDLHAAAAADAGWRCLRVENRTADYHAWARRVWWHAWAGVWADPATLRRVLADVPVFLCNDPYAVHRWAHCVLGTWAWQFAPPGAPWLAPADTPPVRHQWSVLEAAV